MNIKEFERSLIDLCNSFVESASLEPEKPAPDNKLGL